MFAVHFLEGKTVVLSQLLRNIPLIDENIKIKGKKGKVLSVEQVDEKNVQVQVAFEIVKKPKQVAAKDNKKKKR